MLSVSPNSLNIATVLLALASPVALQAQDCPPWLASLQSPALASTRFKSLCELRAAFESAQARIHHHFESLGLDLPSPALRLRGVYGPRLVNYSTDYISGPGLRAHGDPWWIYATRNSQEPTPEVFSKWQDAALWIEGKAADNLEAATHGHATGPAPFDVAFLMTVHTKAFHGLSDWGLDLPPDTYDGFRTGHEEFGYFYRDQAVLEHTFDHLRYPVDAQGLPAADSHPMGLFHPLHCIDESTHELTPREEALVFPGGRRDPSGQPLRPHLEFPVLEALDTSPSFGFDSVENGRAVRRQCGYFTFLAVDQIPARVDEALANLSRAFGHWYQPGTDAAATDPLRLVARTEHWLVGIHPFFDGNGRTLRLLGDYLLSSLGLPAPLYWNTWDDMNYSEQGWAEQVALGMERAQDTLDACADYLEGKPVKAPGALEWKDLCAVVPMTPTPRPWGN